MAISNAHELLTEASACRWNQLCFAKNWNELRISKSVTDLELLESFWSVITSKKHVSKEMSNHTSFLESLELEVDRELVGSLVSYLIAAGLISPFVTWKFIQQVGGLTRPDLNKHEVEAIGDLLKSLIISLLSLSNKKTDMEKANSDVDRSISKFRLLIDIELSLLSSMIEYLKLNWDFSSVQTCLRLSKWLDIIRIFERSSPLKAFCQFGTARANTIIENWKKIQCQTLNIAALEKQGIAIKESLITTSNHWILLSRSDPFETKNQQRENVTDEIDFNSLFCGSVDYLYALEFGSNINRFSSSEFIIPLLKATALAMVLNLPSSNSEQQVIQMINTNFLPLFQHVSESLNISLTNLFGLLENSVKNASTLPPSTRKPGSKSSPFIFVDNRPCYIMKVFQNCRLPCLAKCLQIEDFQEFEFVSELVTMQCRDMTSSEFEDFVGKELLKNIHIAPFLSRTELTRLQLVIGERAAKEDSHLALGVLAAVDLYKRYLNKHCEVVKCDGAVGSFLDEIVSKRISNYDQLIANPEKITDVIFDDQNDNDNLSDLDTFMHTLPDSLAESVGIGVKTSSRLLFLLWKADQNRVSAILRRLILANPTLAFILWLLVDERFDYFR